MVEVYGRRTGVSILDLLFANDPTNIDNVSYNWWGGDEPAIAARGSIVVQMGDDSAAVGDPGYAATIQYLTEDGQRLATAGADLAHNHWGIYTTDTDLSSTSSDTQPQKRFNIAGGEAITTSKFINQNEVHIEPQASGYNVTLRLIPNAGDDAGISLYDGSSTVVGVLKRNSANGAVEFQNLNATTGRFISLLDGGDIDVHGHPIQNISALSMQNTATTFAATEIQQEGASGSTAAYRVMGGSDTDDAFLALHNGDGSGGNALRGAFMYDASRGHVRIQNYDAGTADFLELKETGEIDLHQHPTQNLVWNSGSTRPSSPSHGQQFFDDGLGQPIWYDSNAGSWVDATGAAV